MYVLKSEKKTWNVSQQYRYWPNPNKKELAVLKTKYVEHFPKNTTSKPTYYSFKIYTFLKDKICNIKMQHISKNKFCIVRYVHVASVLNFNTLYSNISMLVNFVKILILFKPPSK